MAVAEMELMDQLAGGALPLEVVVTRFDSAAHARRVLAIYLSGGAVTLARAGACLPTREALALIAASPDLRDANVSVAATDAAIDAFEGGSWDRFFDRRT